MIHITNERLRKVLRCFRQSTHKECRACGRLGIKERMRQMGLIKVNLNMDVHGTFEQQNFEN